MENQNSTQPFPAENANQLSPSTSQIPLSSQSLKSEPKLRVPKAIIIGIILIIFLMIVGFVAYFFIQKAIETPAPRSAYINNNWSTAKSSKPGWIKYTNSGKSFSLEAPSTWIFESYGNGAFLYSPDFKWGQRFVEGRYAKKGASIQITASDSNTYKKSIEELQNSQAYAGQDTEIISLGNTKTLKYTDENVISADFIQNGIRYIVFITFHSDPKSDNTLAYNQILSTFKFTK